MNATEAKQQLIDIPKDKFITGDFARGNGECCAIGHLVRLAMQPEVENNTTCSDYSSNDPKVKEINEFSRKTVSKFLQEVHDEQSSLTNLASVNNCRKVNGFTQDNPKDRVIALLTEMEEWEKNNVST